MSCRCESRETIPVVFAVNKNYISYLGVAISSLIQYASDEYIYHVYVFHTTLSDYEQERIKDLGTSNVLIQCVDISDYTRHLNLYSSLHLSEETVYRILIPDVLSQYDKVIYLDSDLVVLRDVSEFFHNDLKGKALGVVHDILFDDISRHIKEDLQVPMEHCFNAGVLLMDTRKFKEYKIKEKCVELLAQDRQRPKQKRKYIYMDQDVLNITCQGITTYFNMRWNFQWQYLQPERYQRVESDQRKEYLEVSQNPYILHFAGDIKPWHEPGREMSYVFWSFARKTSFYEQIIYSNVKRKKTDCFKTYIFPFHMVTASSNIILYGAGRVGAAFHEQIEQTDYCTVLLWADRNYEKLKGNNPLISSPEEIPALPYDFVVVAIEDKKVADAIIKDLTIMGIPVDKIVWTVPRKNG